MFSWSGKGNHHRNGHLGSGYYRRKSFLGSLINIIDSRSRSKQHNDCYTPQYIASGNNSTLSNQALVTCGKCNAKVPLGSRFCLECGEMMKSASNCSGCGQVLSPNAIFCAKCGKKVD